MSVSEPISAMLRTRYDDDVPDTQHVVGSVPGRSERPRVRGASPARRDVSRSAAGLPSSAIHELRTPLTSIHGYAQVLQRNLTDNPRASNALKVIVRESGRLTQMLSELSDLADLAETTDPTVMPARVEVDLREMAEIVAETVSARDQAEHEIVISGHARALCDGRRVALALTHILTNATLYSLSGTRIAVQLDKTAECVRIAVTDEGIGIADADAERVYRPFERGQNGRELGARGLGLGLFIARQVIEADGGSLFHVSRPAAGTQFVIELPRE